MYLEALTATDPCLEDALHAALRDATATAIAPLPPHPERTLAMLRPDLPLETSAALVVATSGSTGTPKGVMLSADAVHASVEATHQRLGGPGDWTLALPTHYVAGVMVLARSVLAETRCLRTDPRLSELPILDPQVRNYLSVVPTQLLRALDEPRTVARLCDYDAILVGGAALDTALRQRCRVAGLRIVMTYGMSETCGGCVYDGEPLPTATVDIGPGTNRIDLTGPMAFSGYRLRPDLTEVTLTGQTVHTQDRGLWQDGHLQVLGRIDDVVISGGVNVDLAAVNALLRDRFTETVAIGVPDATWGTRVVVATGGRASLADIRDALGDLDVAARPRGLLRMVALPRTSSGKTDQQALVAAWLASTTREEL